MGDYTIKYFMWGYQRSTHLSFQIAAKSVFDSLDPFLHPQIFILGVLVDEREDRYPICVEPEDCGFSVGLFSGVKELAEELEKVDKESGMIHSHPIAQEEHLRRLSNRSYMGAIEKILKQKDYEDKRTFFVAPPTYVEGYQVYTVLSFENQALRRHYSLTKERENRFSRFPICRSLIESTAKVFLNECTDRLKDPTYGCNNMRVSDELLGSVFRKWVFFSCVTCRFLS
jgi:hypothetical protein